jgi:hypothetical protein
MPYLSFIHVIREHSISTIITAKKGKENETPSQICKKVKP